MGFNSGLKGLLVLYYYCIEKKRFEFSHGKRLLADVALE
jgi:hypothetical protein